MSQQEKVKVKWSDKSSGQNHLETEAGQALYICELHRGCALVPFYNPDNRNWGDELDDWIKQWKPLIAELWSDAPDLQRELNYPLSPRPDGGIQATWRKYQLYTYHGDQETGEVKGFWKLATSDLPDGAQERDEAGCPDVPQPPNPRGP